MSPRRRRDRPACVPVELSDGSVASVRAPGGVVSEGDRAILEAAAAWLRSRCDADTDVELHPKAQQLTKRRFRPCMLDAGHDGPHSPAGPTTTREDPA